MVNQPRPRSSGLAVVVAWAEFNRTLASENDLIATLRQLAIADEGYPVAKLVVELLQVGQLGPAGGTQASPEVEDQRLALQLAHA